MPAFVGDLLLSWRIPSAADIPTQDDQAVVPVCDGHYAAGLAQKLVLIRPWLMLAWAGSHSEAQRIVQALNGALPGFFSDLADTNVIFDILNSCEENTEMIALLITEGAVHPFGVRTRGFEIDKRRVYLLGSGAADFFEYLNQHTDLLPQQENSEGQVARATMLRFASQSFAWQWVASGGLENSWGGGFEVAYPERAGFQKVNNILFRAWLIDERGDIHTSGRSFFSRYYGHDLYLSSFSSDAKTYFIPSPLKSSVDPPKSESVCPEWTLDTFVTKEHGSIVDFARYQPHHRPVEDIFHLREGEVVGWKMDEAYVAQCAEKAINVGACGRRFDIQRY
jgi:hypothetical protein